MFPCPDAGIRAAGNTFPGTKIPRRFAAADFPVSRQEIRARKSGLALGLATILAEELDADWTKIRTEYAPADASRYNNLAFGAMQGTGGSTAVANSWLQLRQAGALARALLVKAAAAEWGVPEGRITVAKGVLTHADSGRRAGFGAFAVKAAALPGPVTPPGPVRLKDPRDFKLVGTRIPRLDGMAKTDGTAQFALDVKPEGLVTALIAQPPLFGAKLVSFDAAPARAVPGVLSVLAVPAGVAVVARDFWSARQGREALKIVWDEVPAEKRGTDEIFAAYQELARKPGLRARLEGDLDAAIANAVFAATGRHLTDLPFRT